MFAGMVVGATLVIAALMLIGVGRSGIRGEKYFVGFAAVGLAVAGVIVAVVIQAHSRESNDAGIFPGTSISLRDAERAASSLRSPAPAMDTARNVASVPSLIDGLKRRLESQPENASGWALLAQSYAFVGDDEPAEQALRRAVDLGLDEHDLRQRVEHARRDPHTGLAIESAR